MDLPGYGGGDSLEEITWEEFFVKFEEQKLALAFQDELASGGKSNFNKLISRDASSGGSKAGKASSKRGKTSSSGKGKSIRGKR